MPDPEAEVRQQLLGRLGGRGAHMPFEEAVRDFPPERINERFPNGTYSSWALVEHLRIAQRDILDYICNPDYQHMEWPRDYWPASDAVATPEDWRRSVEAFEADLAELRRIVEDPATDLYAPIPWGGEHTILREILIVCDHNGYHIGELAIMRQAMATWPAARST